MYIECLRGTPLYVQILLFHFGVPGLMNSFDGISGFHFDVMTTAIVVCSLNSGAYIAEIFRSRNYLCDTHTAVALAVCDQYRKESGDDTLCVIASTASPFKFAPAVMDALRGAGYSDDKEVPDIIAELAEESGLEIPQSIAELPTLEVRHKDVIEKEQMMSMVRKILLD